MGVINDGYRFLEDDRESAFKEIICVAERSIEMRQLFSAGNYKSAKVAAEDILRSLNVLDYLQRKKRREDNNQDKLLEVLEQMRTQGVKAELLQRYCR